MRETDHIRHGHAPSWAVDMYQLTHSEANFTPLSDTNFTQPTDASFTDLCIYNTSLDEVSQTQLWSKDPTVGIVVSLTLILCCFVSLVVNIVILSSVCFIRVRVNNALYISLSLAAADTCSLFFFMMVYIFFSLLPRFNINFHAFCVLLIVEGLRMGAIMTNMLHLVALACIHYIGILKPLQHITRRHIQYCIVILWTVPCFLIIFDMFIIQNGILNEKAPEFQCQLGFLTKTEFRTRFAMPFFTTLGLMIFIYVHIYMLVCRHQTQILEFGHRHKSNQVTKKTIVTTIMILGSTILGWLPPFTYYALVCEDCLLSHSFKTLRNTNESFLINTTLNFLLVLKPATNFYIYVFHMKEIRGALRRMRRRILIFLHQPAGGPNFEVSTKSLSRARSRTSTFRSNTRSFRVSSSQDPAPAANGTPLRPTHLRRCHSTISGHRRQNDTLV